MGVPLRIAVDARMWGHSGVGTVLREVVTRLAPLPDLRFTLLGPDGVGIPFEAGRRIRVRSKLYGLGEHWTLPAACPACDVYWTPHFNAPLLPVRARCRVATVHDVFHLAHPELYSRPQRAFARLLFGNTIRRSHTVIAVSEFSRGEILRFFPKAGPKVRVVANGADPDFATGASQERVPGPYLLYVGNVKPHKNLKTALAAFSLLAPQRPNLTFRIVGKKDGFIKGDAGLLDALPVSVRERVVFTGHLDAPDLKSHYRDAACLVLPSLYEGFGLPLLEAMAFGIPIASSDRASLPEVGGGAVLYFNPLSPESIAGSLASVLEGGWKPDPSVYRERLERFRWEETANGYFEVFRSAAHHSARKDG